jgi:hypothetical protein
MLRIMVPTCTKLSKCQASSFEPAAALLCATDHLTLSTLWSVPHRCLPVEQEVGRPQNRCVLCMQYSASGPCWELNPDLSVVQAVS